jgi:uncharacterized protein (DUF58 family)
VTTSSSATFPGWTREFLAALDRLSIAAPRSPRSQLAGPVLSRDVGRALEFADYRAYTPGDDPKLVDWRAYARLDRLYLKQYREERARTISILLDVSASLDWGETGVHKGWYARQLTAALAWIALGRLERIQVLLLRGNGAERVAAPLARGGIAPLFAALGDTHEDGPLTLPVAVNSALAQLRGQGPIVLLSDLYDTEWSTALQSIAARDQGGYVLQVLGPDEWDPPLGDEVELQDSETGELRQTRFGPAERSRYRERLLRFVDDIATTSRKLGLTHVALNTADSVADTLLKRLPAAGILR